jgi:hypothetical protein
MFPTHVALWTPQAIFTLIVEVVVLGLFIGIAIWIVKTWIEPNLPAPFVWIVNVLIGLALLCLLFWFFSYIF